MRVLRSPVEAEDRSVRTKPASGGGRYITSDTVLVDEKSGEPLLLYRRMTGEFGQLRAAVQHAMHRQSGTRRNPDFTQVTESKTFGWQPRSGLYGRPQCHVTGFDQPLVAQAIQRATRVVADELRALLPEQARAQEAAVRMVPEAYRLDGGLHTSGIVNWDVPLRYHRDLLNLPGVWSAMVVLRENASGGMLHIPALGATVGCHDESLLIFSGRDFWHGVTPIEHVTSKGYRTSVVWYALGGLCNCDPNPLAEIEAGFRKRTQYQEGIADRDRSGSVP